MTYVSSFILFWLTYKMRYVLCFQAERSHNIDVHLVTFDAEKIDDVLRYIQDNVLAGACQCLSSLF